MSIWPSSLQIFVKIFLRIYQQRNTLPSNILPSNLNCFFEGLRISKILGFFVDMVSFEPL